MHVASTGPAPIPELAAALSDLSPRLQWKRRDGSPPDGTSFHDGHANALVAGPGGLEEREDVWVGISLLAPHVRYPDHRHHPEEVYVSLAGGAWWNANMEWTTPGPGGLIYNEPNILHAMRTESAAAARDLVPVGGKLKGNDQLKSSHPAFGHLLPFFEREKAKLFGIITFSRRLAWEKVLNGRMRALRTAPAIPPAHENDSSPCNGALRPAPVWAGA